MEKIRTKEAKLKRGDWNQSVVFRCGRLKSWKTVHKCKIVECPTMKPNKMPFKEVPETTVNVIIRARNVIVIIFVL